MQKNRDIDVKVAQKIFGREVSLEVNGDFFELLEDGSYRPLPVYSIEISAAWEIVVKLAMTLIPVDAGWFALVGHGRPWISPAEFLAYLQRADFANSGAAVGDDAALTICLAALKSMDKQVCEVTNLADHRAAHPTL